MSVLGEVVADYMNDGGRYAGLEHRMVFLAVVT